MKESVYCHPKIQKFSITFLVFDITATPHNCHHFIPVSFYFNPSRQKSHPHHSPHTPRSASDIRITKEKATLGTPAKLSRAESLYKMYPFANQANFVKYHNRHLFSMGDYAFTFPEIKKLASCERFEAE